MINSDTALGFFFLFVLLLTLFLGFTNDVTKEEEEEMLRESEREFKQRQTWKKNESNN